MVDPRRLELDPAPEGREAAGRDSQAEALLVDGLDRYFNGRYEDAIHLWTRVLFLDRSHARARAYIDRARTAIAERQRRSDELLQASRDLLDRGQTAAARDLLTEAVAQSGDDEHAAALRVHLERVERLRAADRALPAITAAPDEDEPAGAVPGWTWPRRSRSLWIVGGLAVAALVLVVGASGGLQDWMGWRSPGEGLRLAGAAPQLPVLSSAQVALVRARTLVDRGRLAEALRALDRVSPESSERAAADRLRADIQQLLLAGAQAPQPGAQAPRPGAKAPRR